MRRYYTFAYSLACIMLLSGVLAAAEQPGPAVATSVREILGKLSDRPDAPVWEIGQQLARLPEAAGVQLEQRLGGRKNADILACCYALLRSRVNRKAVDALEKMIRDDLVPLARKQEAAGLLVELGGALGIARVRMLLADDDLVAKGGMPESLRVTCIAGLLKMTNSMMDYRRLKKLMLTAKNLRARTAAALALARAGYFRGVEPELERLRHMPGLIGQEAEILLQIRRRQKQIRGSDRLPGQLINEVMLDMRRYYAPDERDKDEARQLEARNLASVAARALLNSVDPFSDYLSVQDWKDMEDSLHSNYGGIGAWVGMREGRFTILTPMFGKPAFKAGLRSMDTVEKIDGKDIKGMRLADIIKRLKGKAKTKVTVTVWRKGWVKSRDFVIIRDTINVPSLLSQMLPGNIGYIRLNSFADGDKRKGVKGSDELLRDTIVRFKRQNVKGVLLDLTNNPGGLLMTAVNVARVFLGNNKLIVSKRMKANLGGPGSYRAGRGEPLYTGPLVVLINGGSASASEILAGALKDNGRAKLVGEKSFGKGSIQQPIPAWATGGHIKLTVGYYYLPSGRCIHGPYREEGGIKPDVPAKQPDISLDELEVRLKIRDSHEIEKWLENNFKRHEKKFRELLVFDDYSCSGYPDFGKLYSALTAAHPKSKLTPEIVRKELRVALIDYMRNSLGEDILVDPMQSKIIQAGLVTLGKELPGGLPALPLYQAIRRNYEKERKALVAAGNADRDASRPVAAKPDTLKQDKHE